MTSFESDPLLSPYAAEDYDLVRHTALRKSIARRLTLSQQSVPHFYLKTSVAVDPLLRLRGEMNARAAAGERLTLNDFFVHG